MRIALLCIILLLGLGLASAQSDRIRFESPIVTKSFEGSGEDVSAGARVFNPTSRPVRARWIREVTELPSGWSLAISDGAYDHSTRTDSADILIPAYGSVPVTPHVVPGVASGNAQVTIKVVDVLNRRNYAMATFRFEQTASAKTSRTVKIYPNPGEDEFRIMTEVPLSRVIVSNTLGLEVKVFYGMQATYDVSELPNGFYLVGLIGTDGRVIKTLRFNKRTVRP